MLQDLKIFVHSGPPSIDRCSLSACESPYIHKVSSLRGVTDFLDDGRLDGSFKKIKQQSI